MSPLTEQDLKTLHRWVKAHATYDGNMIEDCCCGLVTICKHHADRQETYAKALPPQTMARLLSMVVIPTKTKVVM